MQGAATQVFQALITSWLAPSTSTSETASVLYTLKDISTRVTLNRLEVEDKTGRTARPLDLETSCLGFSSA